MNIVTLPGATIEANAQLWDKLDLAPEDFVVSVERYRSKSFQDREWRDMWRRVWQSVCRDEEIPKVGDWFEYVIFDQSFIIVRGEDKRLRAFHNVCQHRGNRLCEGRGNAKVITCGFHHWQYGLDGKLVKVTDEESFCGLDKAQRGLKPISVDTYGGFVFINIDPKAEPLADYIKDVTPFLSAYQTEKMVAHGLNVKIPIACNWKIGIEAFSEAYHVHAVHAQVLPNQDDIDVRYCLFGDHAMYVFKLFSPSPRLGDVSIEELLESYGDVTNVFAGENKHEVPQEAAVRPYRQKDGSIQLPPGKTLRGLIAEWRRKYAAEHGLDFSRLTDGQMCDDHAYFIFPNLLLNMLPDECVVFRFLPDPSGDVARCLLEVANLKLLPKSDKPVERTPQKLLPEGSDLGVILNQDLYQMPRQQRGLNAEVLKDVVFSRQESRLAAFHKAINRWLGLPNSRAF